ncbi:class A beta-lactamase [Actinopolyspora mortivallis]|uniref:Class A beta-lactamase n=2 Tax=Actinopolyspora mortivallis TaxID=33906 RepID=A0A2T0GT82_ACTMO|nr:class A beta-lactamase [Actinopolyspora mortivallis]
MMRDFLRTASVLLVLLALVGCAPQAARREPGTRPTTTQRPENTVRAEFTRLEQRFGARLGVHALDTGSGEIVTHRADERWAFCSTMKTFTAAAVLRRNTVEDLDRRITYTRADLVPYSPVTERHVDSGMTLREVLRAALRVSDNTAQNLLLRELGGPEGLQRELRELGDTTSHVDRYEPELNEAEPGDVRDTSTPRALAANLREVVLGDALAPEKRKILRGAMRNPPLTEELVQAGMPEGWEIEDKSGAGKYATRNDIAVLYPPERDPIVLVVMTSKSDEDAEYDDALVAEAARTTLDMLE